MTDTEDPESAKRLKRLFDLLQAKDTGGYERVAKRLREARELFHEEIAHQIEAPLNRHLVNMPHQALEEKRTLSRHLRAELRSLGIAIRCPVTNEPAMLHIEAGHRRDGRFQIELNDHTGGGRRTLSSVELPVLEFCSHLDRREGLVDYWSKIRSKKPNRTR